MTCGGHTIHRHQHHCVWDKTIAPVLRIAPGETVTFDVQDASCGQVTPETGADVFATYDNDLVNPVTGPVLVDGAAPGDALVVRLEDYRPSGWGWSAIIPGFGLLVDAFTTAAMRHWHYAPDGSSPLLYGEMARIPLAPFAGTIGVAPSAPGSHGIIPPRRMGGNMDIKDLVAGSVLILPVEVAGALLSIGDTHAAQGDGEVSGTAIESPMTVTATIDLVKGSAPAMPRLSRPAVSGQGVGRVDITTGIGPDLHEAARDAVRGMVDLLSARHGLSCEDAYILCGVAGDLKISQIVDVPNWTVSFQMPDAIFG